MKIDRTTLERARNMFKSGKPLDEMTDEEYKAFVFMGMVDDIVCYAARLKLRPLDVADDLYDYVSDLQQHGLVRKDYDDDDDDENYGF